MKFIAIAIILCLILAVCGVFIVYLALRDAEDFKEDIVFKPNNKEVKDNVQHSTD